jgi:hypothetical protein
MPPVGFGIFIWDSTERRSNRYGSFYLANETFHANAKATPYLMPVTALNGRKVAVSCQVVQNRESGHLGDTVLGITPTMPEIGEIVPLGVAILRIEPNSEPHCTDIIVMRPTDDRTQLWIDPRRLYRLHDQTVYLFIEETDADVSPAPDIDQLTESVAAGVYDPLANPGEYALQVKNLSGDPNAAVSIPPRIVELGDGSFLLREEDIAPGEIKPIRTSDIWPFRTS